MIARLTALAFALVVSLVLAPREASADGCYICAAGSSDVCRNYCRYTGSDTQQNRDRCRTMGCVIGGTASCPQAVNYHICLAPTPAPLLASYAR